MINTIEGKVGFLIDHIENYWSFLEPVPEQPPQLQPPPPSQQQPPEPPGPPPTLLVPKRDLAATAGRYALASQVQHCRAKFKSSSKYRTFWPVPFCQPRCPPCCSTPVTFPEISSTRPPSTPGRILSSLDRDWLASEGPCKTLKTGHVTFHLF